MKVAVVAHSGKTLGGGLIELRDVLASHGVPKPLWYEVPKSRKAPPQVRKALKKGAEIVAKGERYFIDSVIEPGYADSGPDQRAGNKKKS